MKGQKWGQAGAWAQAWTGAVRGSSGLWAGNRWHVWAPTAESFQRVDGQGEFRPQHRCLGPSACRLLSGLAEELTRQTADDLAVILIRLDPP